MTTTKPRPRKTAPTRTSPKTTTYGTFNAYTGDDAPTVEYGLAAALGEFVQEFNFDPIVTEYRAAVNAALPEGVSLVGQELIGPYPFDYRLSERIPQAFATADDQFNEIASRHDRYSKNHHTT